MTRTLVATFALALSAVLAAGASGADQARGEQLFQLCQQCHGPDAAGDPLFLAPAIAGLPQWYIEVQLKNFKSGLRGMHPDDTAGLRMVPMSRWLATDEDITAVSAYLAGLPAGRPEPTLSGGDASKGATTYGQVCIACHQVDGSGNQGMGSPPLTGASDWYMLSSLQRFKAGVRGDKPENQNATMMRGMSATLTDEQAMKDVIAHILTLGN